ncbi:hypothetical protein BTO06_10490 [Tenacibaculum sp. SZ-18]|uniref:hypothetical protein n=1 Tax=Tenacibaculum sp. SZ-18 TaxID=754423 RepID=UPI000C2D01BE|nr:hypothetical protein [Tenacibaculum sp. SZ-18]AUC15543.1 hypothetical protein BTO06_10490 [Tenacibaculum sp. SZ-18]
MLTLYKHCSRFNFIIIPAFLLLSLVLLLKSSFYNNSYANYIIIDFLVTIPFIYFLLIRTKEVPKITVISVFILSTFLASFSLPKSDQDLLVLIKDFIIPVVELGIFGFIFYKARLLFKTFKQNSKSVDFFDTIQMATTEVFSKKIAHFLATEISVFYYLFFDWKKAPSKENSYSYHKEGTYNGVFLGIILVMLIETFVLHLLLEKWSIIIAWILTLLSVYALLQFLALFRSMKKRPILLDTENDCLILRFGFAGYANIPLENIDKIELSSKDFEDDNIKYFSFLGKLCGHNTIIHFKEIVEFETIYGIKNKAKYLALILDDKQEFFNLISK